MAVTQCIPKPSMKGDAGDILVFPVKAAENILSGTYVANETASGLLVEVAAADVANYNKIMIAYEALDNTLGADGVVTEGTAQRAVKCFAGGQIFKAKFDALTQAGVGLECYVADNDTLTLVAAGAKVGKVLQYLGSNTGYVYMYY